MRTVPATFNHAKLIAATMRERDIAEIKAGWGAEPLRAIIDAFDASYFARTLFHDLEPLCMYGLAPLGMISGCARFWIFASRAIDSHSFGFARASKRSLPELFQHCMLLTNLIDVCDAPAMRWMDWLGGSCVLPHQRRGGRLFAQFILVEGITRKRACQPG